MCKLALLLSVELFVLIAAVFLLAYIAKQQLSKWYTYGAVAIVISVLVLMIGSLCCAICCRNHCGPGRMEKECRMEDMRCNKTMMIKMRGEGCPEMMMHEGMMGDEDCCKRGGMPCEKEEACEIKKECCEGKEGKMHKEIIIDTLPDKKVIIKK